MSIPHKCPPVGLPPHAEARKCRSARIARRIGAGAALLSALLLSACGGPGARSGGGGEYSGEVAMLFDDAIEPAAVGLDLDNGKRPDEQLMLRKRVADADAILRVRVQTVNSTSAAAGSSYSVVLFALSTLSKRGSESSYDQPLTMTVAANSESARLVGALEGRLVGKTFYALLRGFGRTNGESEYHYHLVADSKAMTQLLNAAVTRE